MGQQGAGKSTTVRHLTGISNLQRGGIDFRLSNGQDIRLYAMLSALQERPISPEDFINEVKKGGYENVLAPLRIKNRAKGCPDGDAYIKAFNKEGWNIKTVFVLSNWPLPYQIPAQQAQHIAPHTLPSNEIATRARQLWGW